MFFFSRLLPATGALPKPGEDITGTVWQQHMRSGEVALFSYDERTGQLLKPKGDLPRMPAEEVCMIFGSLYTARLSAKNKRMVRPYTVSALYDKRGRWLATFSREGESRRNPGVGLAWILLQFPLLALYGTLAILGMSALAARYLGTEPIRLGKMSQQELSGLLAGGMLLGGLGRLLFEWARWRLVLWHGKPAKAPLGSPKREKLYRRIAKTSTSGLMVPLDVTLVPAEVEWPVPEKYTEWTEALAANGFEHFGQFSTPETKGVVDFWLKSEKYLTAALATLPGQGMWLTVFTRYEDGSSYAVANKIGTGLDQHPDRKVLYLGLLASAENVIEEALTKRPEGVKRRPTPENLLDDYKKGWRMQVEWLRARGTTPEEIKRIDEMRGRPKAVGFGKTGTITPIQ